MNRTKMVKGVRLLIEGMGLPMNDPDFKKTPERVAKLYREILTPRTQRALVSFPSMYAGMVVLRNHTVFTICPHHLLPVKMVVSIGYIPGKRTIGLSKLARVAEMVLTRPLKQEEYTDLVLQKLHQMCDPKGAGIYVVGNHGCMQHRGVRTQGDVVTSTLRGQFLMNEATRTEFLEIVR